jgi:chromosome segregation ATPase
MGDLTPAEHAAIVRETFGLDDPRGKAADALDALVALAERATELEEDLRVEKIGRSNDLIRERARAERATDEYASELERRVQRLTRERDNATAICGEIETRAEQAERERDEAHQAFDREHELRLNIEDHNWPYEWQVATAEREKRKAAEERAERAEKDVRDMSMGAWGSSAAMIVALKHQAERAEAALREIEEMTTGTANTPAGRFLRKVHSKAREVLARREARDG